MKTAFVADSTLGLPPEEAQAQGIHLVPQQVVLEGRSLRDYMEISQEEVLQALLEGKRLSTSQVAPEDLRGLYETLLLSHDRVLSVHVSGKLSGTLATAQSVARAFGPRVLVLDSWSLNGGLQLVLEEARRLLKAGVAWERLEEAVAPYRARVRGLVLPRTLTYLHRSGRIGGLQHFVGSLLNLLPILKVEGGLVQAGPRVRGFREGLRRMAELFHRDFPQGAWVHLAHAGNLEAVQALRDLLQAEVLSVRQAGAAVSVHAGPGTVALFAGPRVG
jgi:DegV family protein with EDD domain